MKILFLIVWLLSVELVSAAVATVHNNYGATLRMTTTNNVLFSFPVGTSELDVPYGEFTVKETDGQTGLQITLAAETEKDGVLMQFWKEGSEPAGTVRSVASPMNWFYAAVGMAFLFGCFGYALRWYRTLGTSGGDV